MAKKKKSVDLSAQEIAYDTDDGTVKILRFNPNMMTVDINIHADGEKVRSESIRFAQLPKHIKLLVRPL